MIIAAAVLAAALLSAAPPAVDIDPGTPDGRARFRVFFCTVSARMRSAAHAAACDPELWRLPDEPAADAAAAPAIPGSIAPGLHLLIVGGAFSDCFPPASTPFAAVAGRLRAAGVVVDYAGISGRSSSESNARLLAAQIVAMPDRRPDRLVLLGHSKGTTDILEMLVRYPDAAARVTAVISVAGAVRGSPLADRGATPYERMLAARSFGHCPRGDGGVIESLRQSVRTAWLAVSPLPPAVHYYSLGAFTGPPRVARALTYPQRQLSKIDTENDGQLLARDELIPGSTLLGFVNADHWGVALAMEDAFPFLAHRRAGALT